MINPNDPDFEIDCNTRIDELFGKDKRSRAVELAERGFHGFPVQAFVPPAIDIGCYQAAESKRRLRSRDFRPSGRAQTRK